MPSFEISPNLIENYTELPDGTFLGSSVTYFFQTSVGLVRSNIIPFTDNGLSSSQTLSSSNVVNTSLGDVTGFESDIVSNALGLWVFAGETGTNTSPDPTGLRVFFGSAAGTNFPYVTNFIASASGANEYSGVTLGLDDSNIAQVIWSDNGVLDGSGFGISFQTFDVFGNAMIAPTPIVSRTVGDQTQPDMADIPGGFALVYLDEQPANALVRLEFFDDNGVRQPGGVNVSSSLHDAKDPEIVRLNNGNLAVVYESETGGVYTRLFDANGTPLTGVNVVHGPGDGSGAGLAEILATDNGGYVISYVYDDPVISTADRVMAQRYTSSGAADGDLFLAISGTVSLRNSAPAAITELADGALMIGGRVFFGGSYLSDYLVLENPGTLRGFEGNDILVGTSGNDTLRGNEGNDIIRGGSGRDLIDGGTGNSVGIQVLEGQAGDDTIRTTDGSVINGGSGNDFIVGGGFNVVEGTQMATVMGDTISGGNGDDLIFGREGDDLIYGDAGNDFIRTGLGADTVYGGDGTDLLRHGDSLEGVFFDGGANGDTLVGQDANDTLIGGDGPDRLRGLGGDDILEGGSGSDRFIFLFREESAGGLLGSLDFVPVSLGHDVILDFEDGIDRIQLASEIAPDFGSLALIELGPNVEINLGGMGTITLLGMAGLFDASDVTFL